MGHTTKKACRDYIATSVASGIILDRAKSGGVFPHDAENCHHLILATLAADDDKLEIHYSLDGTTWFFVTDEAEEPDGATTGLYVSHDTGAGRGGVNGCPPKYVRLITDDAVAIAKLQVRTYGSVVRPPVEPSA